MQSTSDAQLVHQARTGDREAFDQLVLRYQTQALRLSYSLVGDRSEAEDLAQEAFLRAWQNLHVLSDPDKFSGWLRRIVFGVSIDWLRAFRADLFRLADDSAELALLSYPASHSNALDEMERTDLRKRVWLALARLPANYRVPLTMFHFDGLSHARVAKTLNVPESTVRSLVTRARARLRPMLGASSEVFEEHRMTTARILHLTDGESVAGTLRESGLPGEVAIYGDLFYEGPVPDHVSGKQLLALRAHFYAEAGYGPANEVQASLQKGEQAIATAHQHREVVLWLDHRLSDQLLLISLLHHFSEQPAGDAVLSLICIGSYPAIAPFVGLGQLTADQLFSLADTRTRASKEQFQLGKAAWRAFTSSDPTAIEHLLHSDTSALPFLAAALRRHLEQFPSLENGLSRTEQSALEVLRDQDSISAANLFFAVQRREDLLFMGDYSFYRLLKKLASEKHPLIKASACPSRIEEWHTTEISITAIGRKVAEKKHDRILLNGLNEWRGGVHLRTGSRIWRWDPGRKKLVHG